MNTASLGSLLQNSRLYAPGASSTNLASASSTSTASGADFGPATQTSTSNLMDKYKGVDFTNITPNQFNGVMTSMYKDGIISLEEKVDITSDFHSIGKWIVNSNYNPDTDPYYNTPRNYLSDFEGQVDGASSLERARQEKILDCLSNIQEADDAELSKRAGAES